MARGIRGSPSGTSTTPALPKVMFHKIEEEYTLKQFGMHNLQARSYGFNDFSPFERPKHYIQHIEPIESDLARQVEYDMDEQDQEWLETVNAERKKDQIDMVTCETFEIIMDRLEKEWFDLTKNIPKTDFAMPSEDSTCAICDDSEGENSNAIVFCDGCNLAVHQDCYGVPYIPEGQWLCRKCTVSPENPVSCVLCPNEGGAFKQTVTGDWVHLLCAIWVPETRVANEVFMEPITGVDEISKQRWKLKCSLCEIKEGACIQCVKASCFTAFHATCARKEKLLMPMKSAHGSEPVTLTCFCEKHLPKEQQDARAAALERERVAEEAEMNTATLSKSARAYAKTYKPGPPIVPALIINRIMNYIAKVQVRKRQEFVQLVARYWSLKREARRGAPLLKRLHLEPWTANGTSSQSDEDRVLKLELLCRLREDLEKVHELTTLTRKRESRKQAQAMIIRDTVLGILAPFEDMLKDTFARIVAIDRTDYFRYPVSKADVPDYFDIIKKPMNWSLIEEKINIHNYMDSQEFKDDIMLVIDNAILYNQPNTAFHKTAIRIRSATQDIFEELDRRLAEAKAGMQSAPPLPSAENGDAENIGAPALKTKPIGDLEPPLEYLKLLISADAIKDDTELILDKTPLESLFSYELAKLRPPPPPPSPRPSKPKRDRKADLERKRKERESEAAARALQAQLRDGAYGRTRRAKAAAAAVVTTSNTTATSTAYPSVEPELGPEEAEEPGVEVEREVGLLPGPELEEAEKAKTAEEEETEEGVAPAPMPLPPLETAPAESPLDDSVISEPARRPGRKRGPSLVPGSVEPPLVTDVDSRGLFKMFDKGWILPPDQKRGGRKPVERAPLPPPRKRAKTGDYLPSRLSVISTSTSENQTLQRTSPLFEFTSVPSTSAAREGEGTHTPLEIKVSALEIMDVDTSALRTTISEEPSLPPPEIPEREASEDVRMSSVPAPSVPEEVISAASSGVPSISVAASSAMVTSAMAVTTPSVEAISPISSTVPTQAIPTIPAPAPTEPLVSSTSISAPLPPKTGDFFRDDGIQPKRLVHGPDGQVIVELLDTPAVRRLKSKQKKEERRRLLEQQRSQELAGVQGQGQQGQGQGQGQPRPRAASTAAGAVGTSASSVAGPSRRVARHALEGTEAESELSSLSDVGSEMVEAKEGTSISAPVQQVKRGPGRPGRKPSILNISTGIPDELGVIQVNQVLEGGTLVWAKAKTYPWWPAVVYESDDPRIPPTVKAEAEVLRSKGQSITMVQFFDKTRSWGFLSHDKLKMLGEFKELDDELLSAKSTKQKWKSSASRADCVAAYDVAMAEMETHSDIVRAETAVVNQESGGLPPAAEIEGDGTEKAAADVFEGDLSMTTAASGETDPEAITRAFTPESEEMLVDDGD